jgi:SAM-dependent methyltransferase
MPKHDTSMIPAIRRATATIRSAVRLFKSGPPPLPPPNLRIRVNGNDNADEFVAVGERCARDVEAILQGIGRRLSDFHRILDFGCGCGRTVRSFDQSIQQRLDGSDIDGEAIDWCSSHLRFAQFHRNDAMPPLRFENGRFDLIYSISIFSHLRPDYEDAWLAELSRVLDPGGIAVLTTHGTRAIEIAPPAVAAGVGAGGGFLFRPEPSWTGIFPEWYGTSYHSEACARERFGRHFDVVGYSVAGMAGFQDAIILRR